MSQLALFDDVETVAKFPSTRYQGSKLKFVEWIWNCIKDVPLNTVLDAFGGTGCFAYKMKQEGKQTTYNDILHFNSIIGKALIENDSETLTDFETGSLFFKRKDILYPDFIEKTFKDIYYTDDENRWLDVMSTNISLMTNPYKQAIAWFALFQSCIIKRPYNLFHRKNLYLRTQDVSRSFGNKTTWDTPFAVHFKNFVEEANNAVFSNGLANKVLNKDAFDISPNYDMVYIDTPYVSDNGTGVDYLDFYHFLEGITDYKNWTNRIDENSKNKKLKHPASDWTSASRIENSFAHLFNQFKDSTLVVSYRSNGIPSIDRLKQLLEQNNKHVKIYESQKIKYVLSNKTSNEVLIVGF